MNCMNNKISQTFDARYIRCVMVDCYGTIVEVWTENTPPHHQVWRTLSNFMSYHGYHYTPEKLYHLFEKFKYDEKLQGQKTAEGEPFDIQERNVYVNLMPGADDALVQTAAEIFRAQTTVSLRLYPGAERFMNYINSRDDI